MNFIILNWKPVTFVIGLFLLLYGALTLNYPDWDISISILMAGMTYLSADHLIRAIKQKRVLKILVFMFVAWISIDGIYWLYWSLVDPTALIREGQWLASLCLYLLCGMIWTLFDQRVGFQRDKA